MVCPIGGDRTTEEPEDPFAVQPTNLGTPNLRTPWLFFGALPRRKESRGVSRDVSYDRQGGATPVRVNTRDIRSDEGGDGRETDGKFRGHSPEFGTRGDGRHGWRKGPTWATKDGDPETCLGREEDTYTDRDGI